MSMKANLQVSIFVGVGCRHKDDAEFVEYEGDDDDDDEDFDMYDGPYSESQSVVGWEKPYTLSPVKLPDQRKKTTKGAQGSYYQVALEKARDLNSDSRSPLYRAMSKSIFKIVVQKLALMTDKRNQVSVVDGKFLTKDDLVSWLLGESGAGRPVGRLPDCWLGSLVPNCQRLALSSAG